MLPWLAFCRPSSHPTWQDSMEGLLAKQGPSGVELEAR
jgi:hypothetical protein